MHSPRLRITIPASSNTYPPRPTSAAIVSTQQMQKSAAISDSAAARARPSTRRATRSCPPTISNELTRNSAPIAPSETCTGSGHTPERDRSAVRQPRRPRQRRARGRGGGRRRATGLDTPSHPQPWEALGAARAASPATARRPEAAAFSTNSVVKIEGSGLEAISPPRRPPNPEADISPRPAVGRRPVAPIGRTMAASNTTAPSASRRPPFRPPSRARSPARHPSERIRENAALAEREPSEHRGLCPEAVSIEPPIKDARSRAGIRRTCQTRLASGM